MFDQPGNEHIKIVALWNKGLWKDGDYYSHKTKVELTLCSFIFGISSTCDISSDDAYSNWKCFQSLVLWLNLTWNKILKNV